MVGLSKRVKKELYEKGLRCRGICSLCNEKNQCYQAKMESGPVITMAETKDTRGFILSPCKPFQGEIYKHYKGNVYSIVTIAKSEAEPWVELVIYRDISNNKVWARELGEFMGKVNGVKRFDLIGSV